jgi:hypothetical protein
MSYISTEEVSEIRKSLKAKFGKNLKFSIRREGSSTVCVTLVSGNVDFSDIVKENDYLQVNQFYPETYGQHVNLFREIIQIIKTSPANAVNGKAWFDNSDPQSDYFNTAFFIRLNVGIYNKPYIFNNK